MKTRSDQSQRCKESRTAPAFVILLMFVSSVLLGSGCTISTVKYDVTDHTGKVHQNLSREYVGEGCMHFQDSDGKSHIFSGTFTATERE